MSIPHGTRGGDAAGIDLGPTPNVSAWIARLEALPSWRRAIDDMPR